MDGLKVTLPPTVAVILSTYNGEAYLETQLESLRLQSGVRVELYARDDGSTDGTCRILNRYANIWPNLADLQPSENLGPAASFLHLLRSIPNTADYYAFCDQDDFWFPDKLARAVATLRGGSRPGLYCSNLIRATEDLGILGVPPAHNDPDFRDMLFENIATGCTIVFDAAALALINSRKPAKGVVMHDWWCALIVSALGTIHYDPLPSLLYRQHGGNVVGLGANQITQGAKQAMRLLRQRRNFFPIHAQATELSRLYGSQMPESKRVHLDRLVRSKRSWRTRVKYALTGRVNRHRRFDAVVARSLVLAGWY